MKQILQNLKTGALELAEVPCPRVAPGHVLIRTTRSLISAGTERMLVEFGKANLLQKARKQPDKVKQVLDKMKVDGILPTLETVFNRLDEPMPLGYCNCGVVLETGNGVVGLQPGDRVVSNGPHAEIVSIPKNLTAKVPENVADEEAAFTVLSSIGLQGVRLAQPALGERFAVFGLGLIGLLVVQLLQAHGCHVLGIDLVDERIKFAQEFGATTINAAQSDPITAGMAWTGGQGVDGVIITADSSSNDIVHQAAQMSRKRGRIVLVGVVGLDLLRSDFYNKELSFQVSCSYGPGRYDEEYEKKGQDYPFGLVRWTEQRNFQAVLEMLGLGRINVKPLITHRYELSSAPQAYETIRTDDQALGVILSYPELPDASTRVITRAAQQQQSVARAPKDQPVVGLIGAGLFTKGVIMPALSKTNCKVKYIASAGGVSAFHLARKFGATQSTTDYRLILEDEEVDAVLITVQHSLHARFITEALAAGKDVFVEKPLALNPEELEQIITAFDTARNASNGAKPAPAVIVGFNRRFSPHIVKIKELLVGRSSPLCMNMTVNAGDIPADHWVHDPHRGGGRIIGEACHFIDLLAHLAESPVRTVSAAMIGEGPAVREDKMSIVLTFADGSVGTVNYFANGSKSYPKESLEVFCDGKVLRNENFRVTRAYGVKRFSRFKTFRQDKGHQAEIAAFIQYLAQGGRTLMDFDMLINVTKASFAALESANERRTVTI
jgi:predicted dehydrogenase/threonine dehydrogenase-like Zn-dependent dehydrogenase